MLASPGSACRRGSGVCFRDRCLESSGSNAPVRDFNVYTVSVCARHGALQFDRLGNKIVVPTKPLLSDPRCLAFEASATEANKLLGTLIFVPESVRFSGKDRIWFNVTDHGPEKEPSEARVFRRLFVVDIQEDSSPRVVLSRYAVSIRPGVERICGLVDEEASRLPALSHLSLSVVEHQRSASINRRTTSLKFEQSSLCLLVEAPPESAGLVADVDLVVSDGRARTAQGHPFVRSAALKLLLTPADGVRCGFTYRVKGTSAAFYQRGEALRLFVRPSCEPHGTVSVELAVPSMNYVRLVPDRLEFNTTHSSERTVRLIPQLPSDFDGQPNEHELQAIFGPLQVSLGPVNSPRDPRFRASNTRLIQLSAAGLPTLARTVRTAAAAVVLLILYRPFLL